MEEERKPAAGGIEDEHRVAHARERAGSLLFPTCEEKHAGVFGVFYLPKLREVEPAAALVPIAGKVKVVAVGFERVSDKVKVLACGEVLIYFENFGHVIEQREPRFAGFFFRLHEHGELAEHGGSLCEPLKET